MPQTIPKIATIFAVFIPRMWIPNTRGRMKITNTKNMIVVWILDTWLDYLH